MAKDKPVVKKIYLILMFVATLCMSIGYAQIDDISLGINSLVQATPQDGVFISDIIYLSNSDADIENSKIDYSPGTIFSSQIVLGNTSTSTITYQINVHNNSEKEQMFIGVLTDEANDALYSNDNIGFSIVGLEEKVTTIAPNKSLSFTITFKYNTDADVTKNTLTSKLNFRFKEVPKLVLSNEGETYTLSDIYPNYTPQEYTFTVSNYDETTINNVPMTYSFETTIASPLTAKIYDESGKEVTGPITIAGDGQQQIKHTYTLKIIWDGSNSEENIAYNSADDYADKTYECIVKINAASTDEKYLGYTFDKQFDIDINTATFSFNLADSYNVNIEKTSSNLAVTISNNTADNYNVFDTEYELSIDDNTKFTYSIDSTSPTNNIFSRTLSGGSSISDTFNISFAADINTLSTTETATININVISPYKKTISIPITLKLQPLTVTLKKMDFAGTTSTITVYKGKTYSNLPTPTWTGHIFNGWFTTETGGTQITSSTEVTTSGTQTLYARWTSNLLVDYVNVGDYVDYEIYYDNVGTNGAGSYVPSTSSAYNGWRVLSVEGSGDNRYVRLITAGVPMTYRHPYDTSSSTVGSTSLKNLTTGFFSTTMNTSTVTNYQFHRCGFKTSETATTYITSTTNLKNLFAANTYTQLSGTTPMVQSVTKDDLDAYIADLKNVTSYTTTNAEYLTTTIPTDNLFVIPSTTSGSYANYFLATVEDSYYIWQVRFNAAVVYTYYEHGVRPVVSLKAATLRTGGSGTVSSPYTLGI